MHIASYSVSQYMAWDWFAVHAAKNSNVHIIEPNPANVDIKFNGILLVLLGLLYCPVDYLPAIS